MDPFEEFESKQENVEVDPAADFLAREKAELERIENNTFGNDFDSFVPSLSEPQANVVFSDEANDFNGFDDTHKFVVTDELGNASVESRSQQDIYQSISSVDRYTQEPEKIKKWREEQKTRIQVKDAEEEVKKKELREAAKRELEEWYKNRQEQLAKTKENNKQVIESEHGGNMVSYDSSQKVVEWDRIAKHCEFNPKANKNNKDVSRFRSLLLQLKQQPLAR